MTTIPNTITIYIKSNIMGFSFFKLKPSMIEQGNKNENILIDPLVKISSSKLNELPEKVRKSIFFNKPNFNSYIVKTEQFQPYRSLKQATGEGVIDNNISIILNNLFEKGNVLYLKDKPYTCINYQWQKGNWKIDTKLPSQIKISPQYPINSLYYQHTMRSNLLNANQEVKNLPEDIRVGSNFSPEDFYISNVSPDPTISNINPPNITSTSSSNVSRITQNPNPNPSPNVQRITQNPNPSPNVQRITQNPNPNPIPSPNVPRITQNPNPNPNPNPTPSPNVPRITQNPNPNPTPSPNVPRITQGNLSPLIEDNNIKSLIETQLTKNIIKPIIRSRKNGQSSLGIGKQNAMFQLKTFFKKNNLFYITKQIFDNLNPAEKEYVYSISKKITSFTSLKREVIYNVSLNAKLADTIVIKKLPNNYKKNLLESISFLLTKENLPLPNNVSPSPENLLKMCIKFIQENQSISVIYIENGKQNAYKLNELFKIKFNEIDVGDRTEENYILIANNIFINNNNFLVIPVTSMQNNETFESPFVSAGNISQLVSYFETASDYEEKLIPILEFELHMNIFIIQKNKTSYDLPVANLRKNFSKIKYLFIYLEGVFFYPLYFNFKIDNSPKSVYIFQENQSMILLPPIGILLFIFGKTNFFKWNEEKKNSQILLSGVLRSIDKSYQKIIKSNTETSIKFIQLFDNYFSNDEINLQLGGQSNIQSSQKYPINKSQYLGRPANIGYYITISLYLYPGKEIDEKQIDDIKCKMRKDNINKSWSELRNLRYNPQPIG